MGRKDKKTVVEVTPPPPPPPTTATTSSTTASSSSTSSAQNPAVSSPPPSSPSHSSSGDDVSDSPPPPPPPPQPTSIKKSKSKPSTTTVAAAVTTTNTTTLALPAKRPAESSAVAASKRAKKEPGSGAAPAPGTAQKTLFQRVWSDEDEIVILKGMIEYRGLKGSDPMGNVDDFLDFIKNSLHVHDANKSQIVSKVRRLKTRFLNAKKAENEGKKRKISDPHELEVFDLSKRIWLGPESGDDKKVANFVEDGKNKNKNKKADNGVVAVEDGSKRVVNAKELGVELGLEFGFSREEGAVLKEAMRMMGDGETGEVKKALEKANVAYLEAYLSKLKVLEFAAKKVLQGIRDDKC